MTWYWIVILCLLSFIAGYIVKDIITEEKKIEITIHKPKVKGRGNTMELDADLIVEEKRERRRLFKKRRNL